MILRMRAILTIGMPSLACDERHRQENGRASFRNQLCKHNSRLLESLYAV